MHEDVRRWWTCVVVSSIIEITSPSNRVIFHQKLLEYTRTSSDVRKETKTDSVLPPLSSAWKTSYQQVPYPVHLRVEETPVPYTLSTGAINRTYHQQVPSTGSTERPPLPSTCAWKSSPTLTTFNRYHQPARGGDPGRHGCEVHLFEQRETGRAQEL